MPNSGSVVFNGNKTISASSNLLLNPVKTPKVPFSPFFTSFSQIVNVKNGRWVYYSDHHNYFNGYKWSHSRFYHATRNHHASAKVGSGPLVVRYAGPGQWAEAVAKGYGLAQAWYGID
ncbi:lactococcin 972 family bacteriocin [Lactobacillus hominis]|uniref:Bacteriocin n=1 Tax=Lactobacillus hominis DSM 23910 = CRBIP 24.179 TaxID=1423758 RepID=I7IW15_9LACO|nr:lactococcin 972 family bacteriocin [Lactobacillus hominis]KRM84970.1 hypothetical protein FC41_GL001676 [Lactobacillus hominis DSM 23910 = CRBIP 24.179]MCT3348011.1 hypothetical protein [Lactobacillus hominis]CCI82403.1 Protein of unknown function [Lactobacillus hominis DSM 23910 = CRBIP 24.179]